MHRTATRFLLFLCKSLIAFCLFGALSSALAAPVVDISTLNTSISVAPGATATITYTVTNNTKINLTKVIYIAPLMTRISANTCGATLAQASSCTVTLTLTAPQTLGTFLLGSLRVCTAKGRICSVSSKSNQVYVHVIVITSNAYVANSSGQSLSVLNTATNLVTTTIPLSAAGGIGARGLVILPDKTKAYVVRSSSTTGPVDVVNLTTNTLTQTLLLNLGNTGAMVLTPSGAKAYILNITSPGNTVSVINTATDTVSSTITVGTLPQGIAVSPNGAKVYVTNRTSGTVSVIDTSTDLVTNTITVGNSPNAVVFTPDGTKAYVTNGNGSSVSVINVATNLVTTTISVGAGPVSPEITPDGTTLYVANTTGNSVSAISIATDTVIATISTGVNGGQLAISPDGSKVYESGLSSTSLFVIDTALQAITATLVVTANPGKSVFTADGTQAYVPRTAGATSTLNVINTATLAVSNVTTGVLPIVVVIP